MEPHSPTIFLAILAVNATLTVSLAAGASRANRDGLYLWAIALALHTLSFALFGLRGKISDFASTAVAATILSASWAVFAEGLFQFQQRQPPRRLIWLPVVVISIAFLPFRDNLTMRVVVSSIIYVAQTILILVALNQGRRATVGRGQYFVAIGLAPVVPIFIFRAFLAATGQADKVSMFASNQVQVISYLAAIVATILVAIGLLVMSKEQAEDRNRRSATHDQLTGLANRRRIDEVLSKEWPRAKRNASPLSLVMLDVDLFKTFNDRYGHQRGDDCLKSVARILQAGAQRGGDLAARYGGEEFLLILPDTDAAAARRLTETVRHAIEALDMRHEPSPFGKVTISAGVAALSNGSYENTESLLRAADMALYRAKRNGRNQVQVASESFLQADPHEKSLGNFVQLVWQPAYECGNAVIDAQHRALLAQTSKLLTASLSGKPAHEIATYIDVIVRDVVQHFRDEEAIIAAAGFPDTAEHAAAHRQLVETALDLVGRFNDGMLGIGELFQFLAHDVVARHFLAADRSFFPFVATRR
jgi:diguanylate cyclase (GGDEF)-like protein/hemerythrin-like metal-binding protein